MKVLVTGGMGYIGCHTWIAWLPKAIRLVIFDNRSSVQMLIANYPQGLDFKTESADESH
jgi:UDP-glucose 4-epimerase